MFLKILHFIFVFSVQEIVFVMRVILDVNATNVHLDIEDIHTVSHARAVKLVALILTHVKVIALARYEMKFRRSRKFSLIYFAFKFQE